MTQNKTTSKKLSGSKTTKPVQKSNKLVKEKHDIRNISYKEINDKYSWGKYGSFKVIIMKENGYINATKLIHLASDKKKLNDWTRGKQAEEYITEISEITGLTKNELIIYVAGSSRYLTQTRGTYMHPLLITQLAYWISPIFAAKISIWIEEWKKYSDNNLFEYYDALYNLEPSCNENKEKIIQGELQKKLGGLIEVKTKVGAIDLLTKNTIIEIKDYDNWKHGLGQLLSYSIFHLDKTKCLYLFNVGENKISSVKKICKQYSIKLNIYD
ncbi:N domain-containing protein [Acanthamoeba polyphaga mimivirus]|uniref:N domain-containing protein n=1 Tax=Acanthamoeba polyphaga mimivirus TaxID=212035 RepID=A0A2L2DKV9_MIMIV|nr:N domain-containing protein [Acanthamoeba polyphaga mimivirus]